MSVQDLTDIFDNFHLVEQSDDFLETTQLDDNLFLVHIRSENGTNYFYVKRELNDRVIMIYSSTKTKIMADGNFVADLRFEDETILVDSLSDEIAQVFIGAGVLDLISENCFVQLHKYTNYDYLLNYFKDNEFVETLELF